MAVWAAHETEQLINLVRQNHTLYDPSSNDYRNRDVLKTLWNNIANEMNRSDMDCRDRWNSLRDGYRRFVKDEQTPPNGSKPKKKKTWHWSEAMSFLKPYIQERTTTSVIASVDPNSIRQQHQRSPVTPNIITCSAIGNTVVTNSVATKNVVTSNVENSVAGSAVGNGIVSDECSQDENNHHEATNNSTPVSKWQQTFSEPKETTNTTSSCVAPIVISHHPLHQPQDPDEQFFRSLLPDVKVLSPRQRGIFKIQVQQLLQEMLYPKECGVVSQHHPSSTAPQPPTSQVAYGGYSNVYPSERWPSVQSTCDYSKPHST